MLDTIPSREILTLTHGIDPYPVYFTENIFIMITNRSLF